MSFIPSDLIVPSLGLQAQIPRGLLEPKAPRGATREWLAAMPSL
jgi:hypothetical protein